MMSKHLNSMEARDITPQHDVPLVVLVADEVGPFGHEAVDMLLELAGLVFELNLIFH